MAVGHGDRLTAEQVHKVAFSKPRLFKRGYNEAEVDAFVDLVTIELNRRPPGRGSLGLRPVAAAVGLRLKADQNGYPRRMTVFRAIDPHGEIVATGDFDSAEAAYRWFVNSIADNYKMGWRMEVSDDGQWALFDDTGGFTAPMSRRPAPR